MATSRAVAGRAVTSRSPMSDATFGGEFEAGDHAQRRGLAAARGAEQGDQLAGGDVEADIAHRLDLAEGLGDVLEADGLQACSCRRLRQMLPDGGGGWLVATAELAAADNKLQQADGERA